MKLICKYLLTLCFIFLGLQLYASVGQPAQRNCAVVSKKQNITTQHAQLGCNTDADLLPGATLFAEDDDEDEYTSIKKIFSPLLFAVLKQHLFPVAAITGKITAAIADEGCYLPSPIYILHRSIRI